jgi:tetratricopeptide (TPR) repeat protein
MTILEIAERLGINMKILISHRTISMLIVTIGFSACTSKPQDPKITALEQMQETVKKNPSFENLIQLGMIQMNMQDAPGALKTFINASKTGKPSAIAQNDICAAHMDMGHWSEAIEACEAALAIDPTLEIAKNNFTYVQSAFKKSSEVIAALEVKVQSSSNDSKLVLQLGFEHYNRGEYLKAIAVWKRIEKSNSLWSVAQNNIGSAAILAHEFSIAKAAIDEALAADPNNTLFRNNKNWLATAQKESGMTPQ